MHDGVDWKAAPKTAQWWAVDADGKLIGSSRRTSPRSPIFGLRRASKRLCSATRATGARALPGGRDQPFQRSIRAEILFPVRHILAE